MRKTIINVTKRSLRIFAALSVVGWQLLTPATALASHNTPPPPPTNDKIRICHRTAAYSNPYVSIEVDKNAADGIAGNSGNEADHYGEHKGPLFYPSIPKHTEWGDIIPPIDGVHSGLNWTSEGQAIWENGCKFTETGGIKVYKKVDIGNGYVNDNPSQYGFKWGLDGDDPDNAMGTGLSSIVAGDHTVTEKDVVDFKFTGWYYTYKTEENSCTKPVGTTLPVNIEVKKDKTTYITLCNQKVKEVRGTITVHKVTDPANDPAEFEVTASGNGDIFNDKTQKLTTSKDVVYNIGEGTFAVNETPKEGWYEKSNNCTGLVINAQNLERKCTIVNVKKPTLTIVKKAFPHTNKEFKFEIDHKDFELSDGGHKTFTVKPWDEVKVSEKYTHGWELKYVFCKDAHKWEFEHGKLEVKLTPGDEATCVFSNKKLGEIEGYKFNDVNNNGKWDQGEKTLKGWKIELYKVCNEENRDNLSLNALNTTQVLNHHECENKPIKTTYTDYKGKYSFDDLREGTYRVCEVQQDHWTQTAPTTEDGCYIIKICKPGQEAHANFGNHHEVEIQIAKSNDATSPVLAGSTVNYTIVVSVPETSDTVYDAVVADVLPAGFTYVPGSGSASNGATDIVYTGQEGIWKLGNIASGESVTLTYQVKIDESVSPGTYTNIALAQGYSDRGCVRNYDNIDRVIQFSEGEGENEHCKQECTPVYTDPPAQSDVTVIAPAVLGAFTAGNVLGATLVNTGEPLMWMQYVLPSAMLIVTVILQRVSRLNSKKGAK